MHCWARYLFVVVVIALGTLSMLAACGQKGPLVLPENAKQQAPRKATGKSSDVPTPSAQPSAQSSAQAAQSSAEPEVAPLAPGQVQTPTGNLLAWPTGTN
ncbi:lipoprotein [uncultured Thiodictyon sp.]|uniref:LPS translocon maturation chaperone LptM n=1 Tax=uncultured Thiodictyon sp. TaxID=1846217 RepID=UPI0025EF8F6C|nr:lipoprotein [uncultured Thiodictyon sp.]